MKVKKLTKIVISIVGVSLFCGNVFSADLTPSATPKEISDPYILVIDTTSSGTNTTNNQKVQLPNNSEAFYVQFTATSISLGTITPGLQVSVDNGVYGSITASEMVQPTNIIVTQVAGGNNSGTSTTMINAGDYRGSLTSAFDTLIGVGTNTTRRFLIRPIGKYLNFSVVHTTSGTDTGKYKISICRAAYNAW